ncbi:MAG TPA: hypothetical protein VKM36_08995 [Balneolaceae bacterium]|nr:hypothetical protein [Balneolaceae bacterium]
MDRVKNKKLKISRLLSIITVAIGMLLLTYMILVEDEPGAVPLLLIILGFGGYLITRSKFRSENRES